ncbi:hypothetical protein BCR34DRAFT_636064 [Clohesyomyces aquaticus]|uniref:Uncharacterized protein n=1 Tax=Clohesyomyces aquaticus TaxID=1231657 RepID=A0A1Y1YXM5_9PLEO|nr:hypothetical protein BCR34DRAFT_636064 [Clohesyomyces aquaticus]
MRSSQPEPDTVPFNVHRQHEDDRGPGCIRIDVGRDEHQRSVASLRHLRREVDIFLLPNKVKLESCTKVYIIGEWNFSCDFSACGRDELEASEPWVIVDKLEHFEEGEKHKLTWDSKQTKAAEEEEWKEGIGLISKVTESMKNLRELTWVSTLPFTESMWGVLPSSLTKLVLDVSQPVGLDNTDEKRESYLLQSAMKPLVNFTKLEELRIFGMHDSFQAVIWETIYRNEAEGEGIRILDLAMASRPLIRDVGWLKAKRVEGLRVPKDVDRSYK